MASKYALVLFATIFAIVFTTLSYIMPNYSLLWLSLEVIILPVVYYLGYELIMDKQRAAFQRSIDAIRDYSAAMAAENTILKEKVYKVRKYDNHHAKEEYKSGNRSGKKS